MKRTFRRRLATLKRNDKMRYITILGAALLMVGCATLNTPQNCQRATEGLTEARKVLAALQAGGVEPSIIAKALSAVTVAEAVVGKACGA